MNRLVFLFAVGVTTVVVCGADQPTSADNVAADTGKAVGAATDADESGKFFLFAQRSTTVSYTITTSTTKIISTCFTALSTGKACRRRRKRRFVKQDASLPSVEGKDIQDSDLSGSLEDNITDDATVESSKLFFTVWDTSVSTLVVVSTSTDNVNIVSVSAACTVAGEMYNRCG